MKWIGLSGSIGSGKSSVAKILRQKGFDVIDADRLARQVLEPGTQGYEEVKKVFGPGVLMENGDINRGQLAQIVFNDAEKRKKLEAITHPRIRDLCLGEKDRLLNDGAKIAFYEVPLLFEKNMENLFDASILVMCRPEQQMLRLQQRETWDRDQIQKRMDSQLSFKEKTKRANFVIDNSRDFEFLKSQVEDVLGKLV